MRFCIFYSNFCKVMFCFAFSPRATFHGSSTDHSQGWSTTPETGRCPQIVRPSQRRATHSPSAQSPPPDGLKPQSGKETHHRRPRKPPRTAPNGVFSGAWPGPILNSVLRQSNSSATLPLGSSLLRGNHFWGRGWWAQQSPLPLTAT